MRVCSRWGTHRPFSKDVALPPAPGRRWDVETGFKRLRWFSEFGRMPRKLWSRTAIYFLDAGITLTIPAAGG